MRQIPLRLLLIIGLLSLSLTGCYVGALGEPPADKECYVDVERDADMEREGIMQCNEVIECDTDLDCQTKNPHIDGY